MGGCMRRSAGLATVSEVQSHLKVSTYHVAPGGTERVVFAAALLDVDEHNVPSRMFSLHAGRASGKPRLGFGAGVAAPAAHNPPTYTILPASETSPQQHQHNTSSVASSTSNDISTTAKMAAKNLPPAFNATAQDIEMLLSAQCHIGSKNLQVHMEPYLWKTRPDGINVINIGKTWYVAIYRSSALRCSRETA